MVMLTCLQQRMLLVAHMVIRSSRGITKDNGYMKPFLGLRSGLYQTPGIDHTVQLVNVAI